MLPKSIFSVLLWLCLTGLLLINPGAPALANLADDHYDGNIFALYAGDGSLVPPKTSLAEALRGPKPTLLVFYVDDSRDCKEYAAVVSRVQGMYVHRLNLLAVSPDTWLPQSQYTPLEPGYYYQGQVPQTVLFDGTGHKVFSQAGSLSFEQLGQAVAALFPPAS